MTYLVLVSNTVNIHGDCQVLSCIFSYGDRSIFTMTVDSNTATLSQREYVALLEETAKYAWLTLFGQNKGD